MELNIVNEQGQETAKLAAADSVFGREYNEALVHQIVVAFMANARQGTRAQLTRAEVHHTTKKPFKQKGTGRARAGMSSSPLWRKGGRAFPNLPYENFSQKVNKKMYRAAMASIFSKLAADGRLMVVDSITVDSPKTKAFVSKVKALGVADSALIITNEVSEELYLASRNVHTVAVILPTEVDPYSLVHFKHVVVEKAAVAKLEEMLG